MARKKSMWEPTERKINGLIWKKSGHRPGTKAEVIKNKEELKSWGLKTRIVKTVGTVHAGRYMVYIRGKVKQRK